MEDKPLAFRVRPKTLKEFIGQEHVLGEGKLLDRTLKSDRLTSIILFGPPGCGKTSLAQVISNTSKLPFYKLNATTAGKADIQNVIDEVSNPLFNPSAKAILFIDEIHRFNKLQQDTLLPYVENGTVILIGATTENPYFEVNKALISRSIVIALKPLSNENIVKILKNAINSKDGLADFDIKIDDEVLEKLAIYSNGDVRSALNALEIASLTNKPNKMGIIEITAEDIKNCIQDKKMIFDKNSDYHYDTISAFIKSMRGSDPDATVFYLARLIESGEDPIFIARRIVICAAEDVGLANPHALVVANAALDAVKTIGMPEGRIILSEAAIYVAISKKSNASYLAINNAINDVKTADNNDVPYHLRNAPIETMKNLGYHEGYIYPHDYKYHLKYQQYLPDQFKDKKYYIPDDTQFIDKSLLNDYPDEILSLNKEQKNKEIAKD